MSAGDRWTEHEPVKGGDPISPAILLWLRDQKGMKQSALPWQVDPEDAFRPEPAPDGPESEDVLANLLRAIENTDIASQFQNVAPRDTGHPHPHNFAQPAETANIASTLRQLPEPDADARCSEATSGAASESDEALNNLLRAIQSTDVAAIVESNPQAEHAEPAGIAFTQPAEIVATPATLSHELETDVSADLTTEALEAPKASETPAISLDAIQSTEVAAFAESNPQTDTAEAARSDGALPAETAEAPSTVPQIPQMDATVNAEAAPQVAPEADELPALPLRTIPSTGANLRLDGVTPPSERETVEIASSAPAEAAFILEPPVVRPLPSTTKQENRRPKRAARGRQSGRQRLDHLLSIAAPLAAPVSDAVKSEPAKPLPVVAPTTIAEPERPSTAGQTIIADAPHQPSATDDSAPKTPLLARIGTEIKSFAATGELINEGLDRAEMHLENWFQKWFGPLDPRQTTRVDKPPLVAYHWIVDAPQALKIANISAGGLHLVTKDRWSEGNIVSMTLQRTDKEKGSPESWIAVDFLVMRWCEDGMAGAFMPSAPGLVHTVAGRAGNCANQKTLERFVKQLVDATARRAAATK